MNQYVRYRNARRECADLPLEPGDFRIFHDKEGRLWSRRAVTQGAYASAADARAELDAIEQQEEANDLAA